MALLRRFKLPKKLKDESGIALFMVIAAMTLLSILVTEFTYTTQVNQRMAYDGIDQLKAYYLAKSGFKLSLLRLKAYAAVKQTISSIGGGAGAAGGVPGMSKALIEKIWSFPFLYPIPSNLPGMTLMEKDVIDKFTKESGFEGKFSSVIEPESAKYNLNLIISGFQPKDQTAPQNPANPQNPQNPNTPGQPPNPPNPQNPNGQTQQQNPFDPEKARVNLFEYFNQILKQKYEAEPEFSDEYRNFRLDDLVDAVIAWADRHYQQRNLAGREFIQPKKAPFYSLNELRMIYIMEDKLFDLFSPSLTVSTTAGINVNQIQKMALKALFPLITEQEALEFYKFRDNTETDNLFKNPEGFYEYIQKSFSFFRNDPAELKRFQDNLKERGVAIITDEQTFKVTVQAQVNSVTRLIEAWVTLSAKATNPAAGQNGQAGQNGGTQPPLFNPNAITAAPVGPPAFGTIVDTRSGLRVTFMRIL